MTEAVPRLGIGMVGYAFMGVAHSQAWRNAPRFFDLPLRPDMAAVAGRDEAAVTAAATQARLVQRGDRLEGARLPRRHRPGRHLHPGRHARRDRDRGARGRQARAVREAAGQLGGGGRGDGRARPSASTRCSRWSGFTYRRVPAIQLARTLVADGRIGTVRHVRAQYLQDWIADPQAPLSWRLDKQKAGSGALGDIGAHIVDLAQFVTGESVTGVSAVLETFVQGAPGRRRRSAGCTAPRRAPRRVR